SRIVFGVRSTSARDVIISLTYSPAPNSRHKRRNAVFVMPAIGASTTGTSSSIGPRRRLVCVARAVTWQFSQIRGANMPVSAFEGPDGRARVITDATARGLDVEIVTRPGAGSLEEAAALLGIEPRDIVKTLVVRRKTPA